MITDTESDNMTQINTPQTDGAGIRLRKAREAMSLTAKDAATHLHLSVNIINIIENEQFADGPPPAFMRGYLRSYARFLNIPEFEISKTLESLAVITPIKTTSLPILHTRSANRTDRYLRWFTYLIIITMLSLVGLWWHSHQRYIISDVPTKTIPIAPATNTQVTTTIPVTPAPEAAPITTPASSANPSVQADTATTQTIAQPDISATITNTEQTPGNTPPQQLNPVDTLGTTTSANPATSSEITPAAAPPVITTTPTTPSDISPPQVDTPPIISTTTPIELNQTQVPNLATLPETAPKPAPAHKHKQNRRSATLPGMPSVNMALPEPGQ